MYVDPKWVEDNKPEIKRCAYQIFKARSQFAQEDTPVPNFLAAISIIFEKRTDRTICSNKH